MVKSDLLIGVKLKHVLTMGDKSPGIRTPLYKDTNTVPNDCCRICRIYVKISGRSKINVFSPFPFLWNNGARKSHAVQQTLKVRNVFSEVFVDPLPKITLVKSLKINIGRRRKMQAAPKMITYLYKVVRFFFLTRNFSFRIQRFIFCCPKQVSLFNGMTVLEQKMVNTSRHEILVVNVWTAQTGC